MNYYKKFKDSDLKFYKKDSRRKEYGIRSSKPLFLAGLFLARIFSS